MPVEIYRPAKGQEDQDKDVPEFGGFARQELRRPQQREQRLAIKGKEVQLRLRQSALLRALYFGYGWGEVPPVHFPNAEHFQHVPFTKNHWVQFGNMESEYRRLQFMLEKYQGRVFPAEFDQVCKGILSSRNILHAWSENIPKIDTLSRAIYERVSVLMEAQKIHDSFGYSNGEQGAYESFPVFYESNPEMTNLEKMLWEAALEQVQDELNAENYENVSSFLHLYNRIKDPITPLRSTLSQQVRIFKSLFNATQLQNLGLVLDLQQQRVFITQLALESSYLALPAAKEIACIMYGDHHELPYIYIDLADLPRGEYANPDRVVEVIEELIRESESCNQAVLTPITVSYMQEPHSARPQLFIIDGNNRATAVLLMKFIEFIDFRKDKLKDYQLSLRKFISLYDLDIEWERDLALVLNNLSEQIVNYLLSKKELIQTYAHAKIPALLVQEPNFHTVAVSQSQQRKIVLLQPMHQAIYNSSKGSIAIPSKQQSHGRAKGNDVLMSLEIKEHV